MQGEKPSDIRLLRHVRHPLAIGAGVAAATSSPAGLASGVRVAPESSSPEALEGERKTVTALFADIKGSMDLMEDIDPEEARAIVDPALKLMIDAAHRYDGYIVQSTGDGIFAIFGAPLAHEDHPQRALHAALRMQEDLKRYADKLRERGQPIQTGDAHTEYTPIGHSMSLASRLQTLAAPGSVVIGESVRKFIEGYFQLKALGSSRIKGVSRSGLRGSRADRRGDGGAGRRQIAPVVRVQGRLAVGLDGARDLFGVARESIGIPAGNRAALDLFQNQLG